MQDTNLKLAVQWSARIKNAFDLTLIQKYRKLIVRWKCKKIKYSTELEIYHVFISNEKYEY